MTGANSLASTPTSRIIKAPREALYRAFTDPTALAVWLSPGEMTGKVHEFDARVGVPVKGTGLAEGIEVFPKHDAIAAGAFGNAIRGPLAAAQIDVSGSMAPITHWRLRSNS